MDLTFCPDCGVDTLRTISVSESRRRYKRRAAQELQKQLKHHPEEQEELTTAAQEELTVAAQLAALRNCDLDAVRASWQAYLLKRQEEGRSPRMRPAAWKGERGLEECRNKLQELARLEEYQTGPSSVPEPGHHHRMLVTSPARPSLLERILDLIREGR